ncbi:uncharacterized protein [Watersipora subatra]|uniref:uncharacterized protein isoform X3 n=1 Tax=Watersipora subatra TaxID=2589382 RepID=UPI00355C2FED
MRAPDDFRPQPVDTSSIPYASAPEWLRSQRYPSGETFAAADQHAIQVAQQQHDSFKDLLFHLVYTQQWSAIEAARVLFRWMTQKHMDSIQFAGAPPGSPEELIMGFGESRSTYCRIYELLCLYSGIPCITVVGYAKGIDIRPGHPLQNKTFNHSWNVIYVDNAWQLVDPHWAARYLQSNDNNVPQSMVYEYDDFYFCPNPEALIYSHFPDDPKWQLLKQHLSMYDFENLPIAKSAFFKHDLKFLSHHEGVISTQNGCVSLSLGNYNPLSFTYKLLYGESCRDELGGVKLMRYGLQETKDGQVNLFLRIPVKGFYYLTVYSTQVKKTSQEESIFSAVCEYKIVCDVPYPNAEPYPFVSDTNWGPGAEVYQAGLIPNIRDAVIVAENGHIELDFEKVHPVKVLPKLVSAVATEKQCEKAIKQDDNDYISRLDIDLPVNGEYALEVYANDPERDGNTYTHVCQYLLVKPTPGDNSAAVFYKAPSYQECTNVHGLQEPLQPVTMSLEQLARGMDGVRLTEPLTSEPRPSAKKAAQRVEIEQITVPSTKTRPGTAPKPSKGEKPSVAGKPAPKPKPKPSTSGNVRSEWKSPGSEDYANMPLIGQAGVVGPDGYQQPLDYLEQQPQHAGLSQQGAPSKYTERGYGAQPYRGPGQSGYSSPGQEGQEVFDEYGRPIVGDPRYAGKEGFDEYGRPIVGDPRYAGKEGFDEYGRPLIGEPRLAGHPGFDEYGRPIDGDPRYIGKEGYDEYGRPTSGDPRCAGKPGYDEYGRPLAGDPRFAGKDSYDQYGRPLAGDPRLANQEGFDEYGRPLEGNPFYARKEGYDDYGKPLGGDPKCAGKEGFDEYGRPLAGDPRLSGKEGFDKYGRPWTGDSPYTDDHGRNFAGDPRLAGQLGYDEYGRPLAGDPRNAGKPGYDEYGRPLAADPRNAGKPGYDEYGRPLAGDPRNAGKPGYDQYGRPLAGDPRLAGQPGYDEYGRPLAGDLRYAGKPGYDEYGRPLDGDPRLAGQPGYDEYGRPLAADPRNAGKPGYDEYGMPLAGDPCNAGKPGYDEYGRPLVGDPRNAGKQGYDEYGRPFVRDPRNAGKPGYDEYGRPLAADPRNAGKPGYDEYGRPLDGDPRLAGQPGYDEYGRPLAADPRNAGKPGYDEYGRPLAGDLRLAGQPGYDEYGRSLAPDPRNAGKPGYDEYGRPLAADPRNAGKPGYDEYGRPLAGDPCNAGKPGYDEYGRPLVGDPRNAGKPGYDEYGRPFVRDPRNAGKPGYDQYGRPLAADPRNAGKPGYDEYGRPLDGDSRLAGQPGYDEYGRPLAADPRNAGKPGYDEYGRPLAGDLRLAGQPGYDEYGRSLAADPRNAGKPGYDEYGRPLTGDLRNAGKPGYDEYGRPLAGYRPSQEDLARHGRLRSGDEDTLSSQYGGRGMPGRGYSQSGTDEDFPAPPPASDMLNMEFAPERSTAQVPIAPKSFEPVHIAHLKEREVDTQLSNVPKPAPPQLEENLVFSAERAQQFITVDTHAVQVAKTEHNSFRDLIWDLIYDQNITDDLEKARVIFLWLCTKDLGGMQFLNVQPGSPEEILLNVKQGKASYAQIYETLCSYAGLHCRVIRGYAKGADYKPGMRFRGTQAFHAWNSVLIHGHWRLIDCHWASRRMFGKKGTEHIRYELDDYYFCVDPRQLVYTHFPEDKQWQLLEQPYELEEFEDLPLVKSLFFRYCLQLESHTFATIVQDDEFNVIVNYEYYRGPGLEFTFSLHTDDGGESISGIPLSRFGVQDSSNGKSLFRIRPPAVGVYKLAVYAREVQLGESSNRMYCAVVEYRLEVGAVPPHIVPFPACSGTTWGLSPASAKKHGLSTKATSGILETRKGQLEVRFKLNKQLLFSGKLKSNAYAESDLQSCILYRTVGDTAIFSVSVPSYGEYGLEVFVNDPAVDGKTLRHMCQYLVVCNEPEVSGIRFPQLPAAYLGPQQAYSRLGMNTISNKDPLIHCTTGSIEVSFSTATPLRATSNLILTAGNQDLTEYILQQFRDDTLSFQLRLPKAGIYKFQIFAQPLDDASDSLPGVYNYLIQCGHVASVPLPFPKQFSQWKEGCYLYTPVDGDLAAAQSPQDPTPNYIFYQVSVPNASKVAVVVGGEWTHLELGPDSIWEGAAFFQAGWHKEHTAALTANYGSDSASYNTLLEFRM